MKSNQIFTLGTIFDYIDEFYPSLKFWDGYSKHEPRDTKKSYKHRQGMPNEIRIEFDSDDKYKNWENANLTCINLLNSNYNFAIFYVDGGRSPHIHLYDIDELDNFPIEKRNEYRIKFLNKFCPKGSNPDLGLCDEKHLCALEFVNHFKYNKPKRLLHFFWNGTLNNQGMDNNIYFELFSKKKKNTTKYQIINKNKKLFGDRLIQNKRDLILNNLPFEKVFDKYKIEYKGKMALCPFHADSNMSLSFSNEKGLFNCFGCYVKGDIITLIKLLEELKENDNKKKS